MSTKPPQIEQEPINSINPKNLSLKELEILAEYFQQLRPETKLRAEKERFFELQKAYSDQDIADCFQEILRSKEWSASGNIHSPMAFLCKAIPQVLDKVNADRRNAHATALRLKREKEVRQVEEEQSLREEALNREAELLFEKRFPGAEKQDGVIEQYFSKFNYSFQPPARIKRMLAIRKWFEEHQKVMSLSAIG